MRPKKRIALWGADANQMGVLAFLLRTHGWNVVSREVARTPAANLDAGLVVCDGSQADAEKWARAAQAAAKHRVVAILGPKILAPQRADLSLPGGASNQELLERLAIITARKRGPRKGTHRKICADISEISTGDFHREAATVDK